MAVINGIVIMDGISILFALIAIAITFRVVCGTDKKLRVSYIYLLLAITTFAVSEFLALLNGLQIIWLVTAKSLQGIFEIAFIVLFAIGIWNMYRCINSLNWSKKKQ